MRKDLTLCSIKMINLNETPEEISSLQFGQQVLLNSVEMFLAGDGNKVTLVTTDSRHQLFHQLVQAQIVSNDDELVIYKNFVKHLRYNDDLEEHTVGRALMSRSEMLELIKSGHFRIG